jgi:hypothetical protein
VIDRRGSRFAFEALFLVALAVGLALADVRPLVIVGVMALGWVLVAAVEWASWRGEPHYGSGLPPRYYVPRVSLPPAQPLEQVRVGYPEAQREEAPTWIASAALRAEVLGAWPSPPPPEAEEEELDEDDEGVEAVPLPPPVALPPLRADTDEVVVEFSSVLARYTLDPLAEQAPKRRFGRHHGDQTGASIEVPERPAGRRALPGSRPA